MFVSRFGIFQTSGFSFFPESRLHLQRSQNPEWNSGAERTEPDFWALTFSPD